MPELYDKILITGGSGMLAGAVARRLEGRGFASVGVDLGECDITDESAVAALFERHRPTLLINCAAYTQVDRCEDESEKADAINGLAVGRLARWCGHYETALVHYSTDFVFDGRSSRPYRPDDAVGPLSAYGRSKLLGEKELQAHAPASWLLIRTAWLYGRGGGNFPRTMVECARAGKPLRVVNDQFGSPTFTDDLADATLELLHHHAGGIWHFSNGGVTNWFDFAKAVLEEFGVEADLSSISTADWVKLRPRQAARPLYSVLDSAAYVQRTGRAVRPWREALRAFHQQVDQAGGF